MRQDKTDRRRLRENRAEKVRRRNKNREIGQTEESHSKSLFDFFRDTGGEIYYNEPIAVQAEETARQNTARWSTI